MDFTIAKTKVIVVFLAGFCRIFYRFLGENTQGCSTMLVTVAKSCMLYGKTVFNMKFF